MEGFINEMIRLALYFTEILEAMGELIQGITESDSELRKKYPGNSEWVRQIEYIKM